MSERLIGSVISIHALLAESDPKIHQSRAVSRQFLSTLSLRRATTGTMGKSNKAIISIHALLAESDGAYRAAPQSRRHFYPRSPCGERRGPIVQLDISTKFLSTLSLRRATPTQRTKTDSFSFLSTLSLRRATGLWCTAQSAIIFLSTLSLRRATSPK